MDNQKLLPVPELFKKSFELYKPRIWTMLLLGLIGSLGTMIIGGIFGIASFATFIGGRVLPTFNLLTALLFLIGILLIIILNLWVQIALFYMVKEENVKVSIKNLLLSVKEKMISYYWIAFLKGIVILVGLILFIIPGIIFSIWFSFSQYVFVFEGIKGEKALSRSKELVKGYFWPVLGRLVVLLVIMMLISSISKLGFLINSLITMPFGIIYIYVIYEDLKRIRSSKI